MVTKYHRVVIWLHNMQSLYGCCRGYIISHNITESLYGLHNNHSHYMGYIIYNITESLIALLCLKCKVGLIRTCFVDARISHMSPALDGSSAIRHFELSDALKIHDGIIFDFYTGLPHIYMWQS